MIEVILGALVAVAVYATYTIYTAIKTKPQGEPLLKWLMKMYALNLSIWNKDIRGSPFFFNSKRGASVVITALTLIVVLFVASIVMSQLGGQATTIAQQMNDTGAINYIENVKSMGWNAFYLFAIAVIILAAAFIIRIVQSMGGTGGGP